ncbi:MAG TPA: hypothetical protein VNM90_03995 [Haliangium sp.]|nr:hypothetical protein [Haliangium sp.]
MRQVWLAHEPAGHAPGAARWPPPCPQANSANNPAQLLGIEILP